MLYNSDWLLAELENYRAIRRRSPVFVSDWDCYPCESTFMDQIVASSLTPSRDDYRKYSYAEDQFAQRELIAALLNKGGMLKVPATSISVASNATNAIYLCLQALDALGVKRFLVITPVYYTIIETLISMQATAIFHHLRDEKNFGFDLGLIENVIDEQEIDAVILTDPVYSAGVEVIENVYEKLSVISDRLGVWLICDHSLGGLHWNSPLSLINSAKVSALQSTPRSIFIDSLTKRLFLNGLKHALIIASDSVVKLIHDLASRVTGGLCSTQLSLLEALFTPGNESDILDFMDQNRRKIKSQYLLLQSALNGTQYSVYHSDSSYFSMICHESIRIRDVDSRQSVTRLLYDHDLYVLPSEHFHYGRNNRFGFRINLINDMSRSLPTILGALSHDTDLLRGLG